MDFIPTGGISNVNIVVFEFTPQLPNKTCFLFYNLSIEACCEGKSNVNPSYKFIMFLLAFLLYISSDIFRMIKYGILM